MQFVVLIYIFIQVHLPSDLLKAEQCQMMALWLSLMSGRMSGWLVQEQEEPGWDAIHMKAVVGLQENRLLA